MKEIKKVKKRIGLTLLLGIIMSSISYGQDLSIKESLFYKSLTAGKYILPAEDGWWNWCMAPIYDEKGKLHVFMSAIPNSGKWSTQSKILHFTADTPAGHYTFIDTTFSSNSRTFHNPQISKVGDTYVLVYITKPASTPAINQEIGIATTKSLYGKWKESPLNPIIKASGKIGDANKIHSSNPTFVVDKDGKYRIYYKSMTDKYLPKKYREISLAVSDNIEGPYVDYPDNPLISYADHGVDIEDPYAFYYKGMYYMIVEDRMGGRNFLEGNPIKGKREYGGMRPGLLYKSKDGIKWERPELAYPTNNMVFNEPLSRTERPHILWKNGRPEYIFLANHLDKKEAGFYMKINDWN